MKKSISIFLLMFSIIPTFAQKQGSELIDSLKYDLKSSIEDTNKVRLLGKLSFQYFRFDTDSGIYFAEKAITLAEKLQWGTGIAFSYNYMGTNYAVKGNYPKALEYFHKSLSKYTEIDDKQGMGFLLNNLGNFYRIQKEFTKSIEFLNKAVIINLELNNKIDLIKNYVNLGFTYSSISDFSMSNDYYYKALSIAQEINNKELVAQIFINIAENKTKTKNYCGALELSISALKISEESNLPYDRAVFNKNIGEIYLIISSDSVNVINNCEYYSNNKKKNLLYAEKYLNNSIVLLNNINDLLLISETSLLLSQVYEKLGDSKNALLYYKKYSANKDSVFSKDNSIKISNIEKKQEVELRDKQIKIQALEIDRKNSQIIFQIIIFILFLFLMSFISYFYYRRQKNKKAIIDDLEKKKNDKALRESEERFRSLYEDAPVGLYRTTPDGEILLANRALIKMLGYSSFEELSARNLEQSGFEPSYQRKTFIDHLENNGEVKGLEAKWIRRDTNIINVKENAKVIRDSNGNALFYDGTVEDITERKRAEKELKESEEKYRALVEQTTDGILITDYKGDYLDVNNGVCKMLGYSRDEILSMNMRQLIHEDDLEEQTNTVDRMLKGESFLTERRFRCKNGLYLETELNAKMLPDGRFFAFVRDITKRKQSENEIRESNKKLQETLTKLNETQKQVLLQEKLRSLGQMTSGICHDINNSLTPIMGYLDMLTDDKELMERSRKYIDMVIKSAKNIAGTKGRLKEFYKVKLDNVDLSEKNINKIIDTTIELTSHKWKNIAESTGSVIVIKREFQKNLPLTKVDESELIEALTNVILNGCDAMIDGGSLAFRTYQKEENIVIEVHDTGIGMDEETLNRCLDPFYSTKGDQGTGLGLSMVFGVIDRHKGEIKIESERNKGTIIKMILPVSKSVQENKNFDEIVNLLNPLKVLSVEDDKFISEMLQNMLVKRGNKVELALNGKLGLELYKQAIEKGEPFDLVITDLGMAEMDGIALSKIIKELTPGIPIILLTGFGTLINKADYKTVDCLLKKPIMMQDLFTAIAELLKDK